jgi:hypothetical protein
MQWLKRLIAGKELKAAYEATAKAQAEAIEARRAVETARLRMGYATIRTFDKAGPEFLAGISEVHGNEPFFFLLHDLREQFIALTAEADADALRQISGMIKGIDNVRANIIGYHEARKRLAGGKDAA